MVQCVICQNETILLVKNRGIGDVTIRRIGDHYIKQHGISAERDCLKRYLRSLLLPNNREEFIPLLCPCNEEHFLTEKDLAIHQLQNGCDINVQMGGARVSYFDDETALDRRTKQRRQKVVDDEEVDDYYVFKIEENNVASVKMYEFTYNRIIHDLGVDDAVLPPLSFLGHAVENIRKVILANKFLKDKNGGWRYGKLQLIGNINNTLNNSFLITEKGGDEAVKAIGPELTFVASPLSVTEMTFNTLLSQQKNYLENKMLESQDNGSGWTLHSISMIHAMLVVNPSNISAIGLRKLVGGVMPDFSSFDMGKWDPKHAAKKLVMNEVEVEGDESEDESEDGINEYDKTDKFINDDEEEENSSSGDVSFYLKQNSKRRHDFEEEEPQAGPSRKKTRLEEIIESYESKQVNSCVVGDVDGQIRRKNLLKLGRNKTKKKIPDDIDDHLEVEEGADIADFTKNGRNKDYTFYLEDYAPYDAFKPILENPESEDLREKNTFKRKKLSHCILKSILGAIYMSMVKNEKKKSKKGKKEDVDIPDFLSFVESLRNGTYKKQTICFQFDVLRTFSETTIKGCYFNEVLHYVKSIEHAMNKTLYLNVFLEQKTVQSCSIYSDKKSFKLLNDNRGKEFKIRRPMKLIYPTIVPLPKTKTVENSMNILIRKPSKIDPLLLHCVTITNLNKMFKVVSLTNKESTNSSLFVCAGCTTSYVNLGSYHKHVRNCKTNMVNKVQLLEKTYMKYDYRCARRRSFKTPFHIVFDVETKSCKHEETMEAEMKESASKSTKERLRRLVLNSYAITVFAEDLPNIDSFTIYRSLTNKDTIKFTMEKLPASLEEFVDEEDLYYRKWVEEKEINMYNFADLLVADLNLISQSMISFCNIHAMNVNRDLDETKFDKRKLKKDAISKHLPCCICKQYFADYTYDNIMNGGVDKTEFKKMIRKEYQTAFRESVLIELKDSGKVKDDDFLNKKVDDKSVKTLFYS